MRNQQDQHAAFTELLLQEWKQKQSLIADKKIISIYFGGGTPLLLGAKNIAKILETIPRGPDCEITIEANPESVTIETLRDLKAAGINRLSIGLQSLNDNELKTLGRTHSSAQAIEAVESAYQCGFDNITVDLLYEIPGQTPESWDATLKQVCQLPITHLSLYNLTFEPNTPFYRKRNALQKKVASQENSLHMLDMAVEALEKIDLKRYEISAFAKDGMQSCHNTGYWRARPFLGLGPSAFSYFEGRRFRNHCNLVKYRNAVKENQDPADFSEKLAYPDNVHELLAVELRLFEGVDLNAFEKQHSPLPTLTYQVLDELKKQGWLEVNERHWRLTEQGTLFYDSIATALI